MVAIRARFDGKVFVPDEAIDLPRDQRVIMHVESEEVFPSGIVGRDPVKCVKGISKAKEDEMSHSDDSFNIRPGTPASDLLQFVGMIDADDLRAMSEAIEEGCEQVEPDGW